MHVAEVAVKKRSTNEIGWMREIGSASNSVPTTMVKNIENKIIRLGEKCASFFLPIEYQFLIVV